MPVHENHGFPTESLDIAKIIDVATAKRATLASFLHTSAR